MYKTTISYLDGQNFIKAETLSAVYHKATSSIRFLERRMKVNRVSAVIRNESGAVVAVYAKNPDAVPPIMWEECSAVPTSYSEYWYSAIDDDSGAYYVEKARGWVRVEWCEYDSGFSEEPEEPEEPEKPEEPEEPEELGRIFAIINRINW